MSTDEEDAAEALLDLKPHDYWEENEREERKGPVKKRRLKDDPRARHHPRHQEDHACGADHQHGEEEEDPDGKPSKPIKRKRKNRKSRAVEHSFPVLPRVVQFCAVPKSYVNHSYRDFSGVPPEEGYVVPTDIGSMSFSQKLHHLLSHKQYHDCIGWVHHGRAFRITCPKNLEKRKILQTFFGNNRYSFFLTRLRYYGLKRFTQGKDVNAFYHECMLRGMPHLCKYMPEYREGRKLITDPQNEPDLATISLLWPIPAEPSEQISVPTKNDSPIPASVASRKSQKVTSSGDDRTSSEGVAALLASDETDDDSDNKKKMAPARISITTQYIDSVAQSLSWPRQDKQASTTFAASSPTTQTATAQLPPTAVNLPMAAHAPSNDVMAMLLNQYLQQSSAPLPHQQPSAEVALSAILGPLLSQQQAQWPANLDALASLVKAHLQQQSLNNAVAAVLGPPPPPQNQRQNVTSLSTRPALPAASSAEQQQQQQALTAALISLLLHQQKNPQNKRGGS